MPIHLVIHGHFYQPPRENPWTGILERQESAAPYHDWNARIAEECYRPNAGSRVLDAALRIRDIVNNYARLSFNFGPTLLGWLAREAPDVLAALQDADRQSLAAFGHGNAIAQAYNHMILPLATPRDRWTQIVWGVQDFAARFGRPPEAMWLAETAVDPETLRLLVRAGMRYVILAPSQAARWRPLGTDGWITRAEAEIDPRRPYRWILRNETGEPQGDSGIDVCFYHAPLSRGISFQHYLRDAGFLADRIAEAGAGARDPLVLLATDGESFGHHERHGDMCLANLFAHEGPRRDLRVTNLAAFLEARRPTWEVELLPESAWSCSHGVGRWREDCGCSTGGGPGWNQAWRKPLRRGLDRLRDALEHCFADEGGRLFRDPWAARDEYILLLLDPAGAAREAFFARHLHHPLAGDERTRGLRLLEMQHQAMLMYTSCGWFFSDVSGIETLQNLRYAARAIELAAPFAPRDLEAILLDDLAKAKSNVPEQRDGRHLWERDVPPSRVTVEHAVGRFLVEGLLGRALVPQTRYRHALVPTAVSREGGSLLAAIRATDQVTGETHSLASAARLDGSYDVAVGICPWPGGETWEAFCAGAREALAPGRPPQEAWLGRHAMRVIRLKDFLRDEQQAILEVLSREARTAWARTADDLCAAALPTAEAMVRVGMSLPRWLRALFEERWSQRFAQAFDPSVGLRPPEQYAELAGLADLARHLGLRLDLERTSALFGQGLVARLDATADSAALAPWQEFLASLHLASHLGLAPPERPLQNRLFRVLRDRVPAMLDRVSGPQDPTYTLVSTLLTIAARLQLSTEEARGRLRPLEDSLAQDPAFWP
jgi:alpha-amylase/alpha-mannosidase (GH57 family)